MARSAMRAAAILLSLMLLTALPACADERPRGDAAFARGPLALTDISAIAGVEWTHDPAMSGRRFALESIGPGGALFDADGDGDLDLLCLNGGPLPGAPGPRPNALFINDGRGRFSRAADIGELADPLGYAFGCAVADVDDDGDLDVYVARHGRDLLLLNEGGGRFVLAPDSGIVAEGWSVAAAFADFDGDGRQDIYVVRYLAYDPGTARDCFNREHLIYCGPQQCGALSDVLYMNLGGGRFADRSREAFGDLPAGKGLAVAIGDHDDDGRPDVYVANDQTPNFLFRNEGGGRFSQIADLSGVALSRDGVAEAGMGVAFCDLDGDLDDDICVTNFEDQTNSLYRNDGGGFFEEMSWDAGLGYATRGDLGWAVLAADFDLDGRRDLFFANGHVYDNAAVLRDASSWKQRNRLFLGGEGLRFAEATPPPAPLLVAESSRGACCGDIDGDGDPDLVVFSIGAAPQIIRNDTIGRSLLVDAVDVKHRLPVPGATVTIRLRPGGGSGELRAMRGRVQGAQGFASHSDLRIHFGLDRAAVIDEMIVDWPRGGRFVCGDLPAGVLVVTDPGGRFEIRRLGDRELIEVREGRRSD